jgi:hypothetical protein
MSLNNATLLTQHAKYSLIASKKYAQKKGEILELKRRLKGVLGEKKTRSACKI